MTRKQELRDIMDGLVRMAELKRDREDELKAIDEFLRFNVDIAKATASAIGISVVTEFANKINARFVAQDHLHSAMGERAKLEVAALSHMLTPAQKLRKKHKAFLKLVWKITEEEYRWVAYDRVYNPFEWEEYSSGESDTEDEMEAEETADSDSDDHSVDSDESKLQRMKKVKKPKVKS